MQILHRLDDFLYELFPTIRGGGNSLIINELGKYYTYGPFKPKVSIKENWVSVEIDVPAIQSQNADYKQVVALCEKAKYTEAKTLLTGLIAKNPTNSEYHRIYGQILSDEGDQEEAINYLIDALRWDPKNGWALLMMGNIFAKFKNDIPTAMKYYDQALKVNPNDNIAVNNIGANLMQQGKLKEAKKYFEQALAITQDYPNTHYALSMIAETEGDLQPAFNGAIVAIRKNASKDKLYQNSVSQAFSIAQKIIATDTGKKILKEYLHKLEFDGGTEIEMLVDGGIETPAKIEFAENYNRDKHTVKYKSNYPAVEHLQMHELVHLQLVIEARKENLNQLFVSTQVQKAEFIRGLEPTIKRLNKMGIPEKSIADYCSSLFDGMNRQIYNTPIDLFIENFLYHEFAELRPWQFLSLYALIQEGIKAVTDKKIVELSPKDILSKSKVYNLISALQFKELFGLDFTKDFQPTFSETRQAAKFYDEYLEYRDDRKPAEEYEMVQHWAEDLKLDKNFELVNENEYRKRTNIDGLLESIENDPFDLESKDPRKEREMEQFQKSQKEVGINMAVVMYMVEALQFFEGMPPSKIKAIAHEIAMQGAHGISANEKGYSVSAIPGKEFSGYHLLAYYYVSWKLALPEKVAELNLPFEKEYGMAMQMKKS